MTPLLEVWSWSLVVEGLPLGGYVWSKQAAVWWVAHVIIESPHSQLDLDLDLGLLWVWVWVLGDGTWDGGLTIYI